ncbi:unnamed protein product (macronuclear) [Paramecium tetraurelia]|uniref:Uncharacterized protein n=1 Tax=Paramecium tetraurelia TaxID=5888 RepID=A0D8W3_PARTE|nr:uncharacterized protein GSPATT00014426001 [Paramecium tetraurelia]CAK79480.1 unnamed protein product [Paramecium tetraurelia]|eukprot:XP_001446877.1 hypothetical protein (macronuclear) [Paramecium tetraurelia strain d4-2]
MGMRLKKLTQTLESKPPQQYNFPRGADQFEYSPDRSYSSLQVDVYDLNSQLRRIHRRVLSQVVIQKGKSKENKLSTLSPLKVDQLAVTKAKLNSQRFFLMNQVRNIKPKQNKLQSSLENAYGYD